MCDCTCSVLFLLAVSRIRTSTLNTIREPARGGLGAEQDEQNTFPDDERLEVLAVEPTRVQPPSLGL